MNAWPFVGCKHAFWNCRGSECAVVGARIQELEILIDSKRAIHRVKILAGCYTYVSIKMKQCQKWKPRALQKEDPCGSRIFRFWAGVTSDTPMFIK